MFVDGEILQCCGLMDDHPLKGTLGVERRSERGSGVGSECQCI